MTNKFWECGSSAVVPWIGEAEKPRMEKNMKAAWFCECQRYFVETGQFNSKGNPIKIPVTIRKMHISGNFIFTDYYRITLIKRKAGDFYSIKMRKKPERAWWDKAPIKEEECKMVKEGNYNRAGFISWLGVFVENGLAACVDLETCPPDKLEAAA